MMGAGPTGGPTVVLARAGFVSRTIAFFLDVILVGLAAGLINSVMAGAWGIFGLNQFPIGRHLLVGASISSSLLMWLCWFPLAWHLVGCSPGKAIVGLRVVCVNGHPLGLRRALLRFGAYWLSGLPLFLGFLWSLVDPEGRTWHDHIAGTRIVRRAVPPVASIR
jgi:uncharacterized RDD family membrane protein YckC